MKALITTATILVITLSIILITGLNNYRLAINETQKCDGSDGEITHILYQHGFDLDVFETPTTIDYIKSPFKYSNFK